MTSLQNQLGLRMMCLIPLMYMMLPDSFKQRAIASNLALSLVGHILRNVSHVMIPSFVFFKCLDNSLFTSVQILYTLIPWSMSLAMSKICVATALMESFFLASTWKGGSEISITPLKSDRSESIRVEKACERVAIWSEYHHHFESNVGLSAFGSQEPEPVP